MTPRFSPARSREGARQPGATIVLLALLGGSGSSAFAQAGGARPSPPPAFPATVELVKADVVVLDKAELPVTGLTRDHFTVLEDGVVRPIQSFESIAPAEPPDGGPTAALLRQRVAVNTGPSEPKDSPHFLVLFDSHRLSPGSARRAAKSIRHFLAHSAGPSDWVTLASTFGSLTWTGRLRDLQDLLSETEAGQARQTQIRAVKAESGETESVDASPNAGNTGHENAPDERHLAALLALDPKALTHECRPET